MNEYMKIAVEQAMKAFNNGDVPVGAIIVCNNKVIAKSYNKKESENNAIKHAEICVISDSCKIKKSWHLDDCILYCTMEPCMMCCGAILQSRIKKVFYLLKNEKYGCTDMLKNSRIEFIEMKDNFNMKKLLNNFFKSKR